MKKEKMKEGEVRETKKAEEEEKFEGNTLGEKERAQGGSFLTRDYPIPRRTLSL